MKRGEFSIYYAEMVANEFCKLIEPFVKEYVVAGSIRRRKEKVHDIDLVVKVDDPKAFLTKMRTLQWINKNFRIIKGKEKLINSVFKGVPLDIYITTDETFETTKLIRTGSAEFNRMLCMRAREMGLKLKANGTGLVDSEGNIIENTEEGILKILLGRYVKPEEREVKKGEE